jgi:hypothetical protein
VNSKGIVLIVGALVVCFVADLRMEPRARLLPASGGGRRETRRAAIPSSGAVRPATPILSAPARRDLPDSDDEDAAAVPDQFQRALRELRVWAERDAGAALSAALSLPPGEEREQALSSVCFGVAQNEPSAAVRMAQILGLNDDLANLVQQWAVADESSALAWAMTQPSGPQREEYLGRVVFVLALDNPAAAARLAEESMPDGPTREAAALTVVHQWARKDPVAAASWIATLSPGSLRDRAAAELAASE